MVDIIMHYWFSLATYIPLVALVPFDGRPSRAILLDVTAV
jgi:hypothetical protein